MGNTTFGALFTAWLIGVPLVAAAIEVLRTRGWSDPRSPSRHVQVDDR